MLNEPFDKAEAWGKKHNIPPERIFLGEFGMIRQRVPEEIPHAFGLARHLSERYDGSRTTARLPLVGLVVGWGFRHYTR